MIVDYSGVVTWKLVLPFLVFALPPTRQKFSLTK